MNPAVRIRLALLVAAIALIAGLTLWMVQRSWGRITELENRLTTAQLDTFHLADEFQSRLLNLNNSMLRYAARHEQGTWSDFAEASVRLDEWIDEQKRKINTPDELKVLAELDHVYDLYRLAAEEFHTNGTPALMSSEAFARLANFDHESQTLLTLGQRFAGARRVARESFLEEANAQLDHLRTSLFAGVTLLLALVAALGVVIYRDMVAPLRTKLVENEALLERQEKLATLGTLAAGIAHEIRNPLTSLKARLYTLSKHIKGNVPATNDASIISVEIVRLERIVQDVLQFARPSEPKLQVVATDRVLREVHSLMVGSLEVAGVKLAIEESESLFAAMDVELIKQVLINLIRNAGESIAGTGTVTIRARSGHARLHGEHRAVAILEVADTGAGIPADIEKRLFDPFFTTKDAGTGLGLSIAARILEKHGGALQYQTQLGHGTTFGVLLPAVPAPAPAQEPTAAVETLS